MFVTEELQFGNVSDADFRASHPTVYTQPRPGTSSVAQMTQGELSDLTPRASSAPTTPINRASTAAPTAPGAPSIKRHVAVDAATTPSPKKKARTTENTDGNERSLNPEYIRSCAMTAATEASAGVKEMVAFELDGNTTKCTRLVIIIRGGDVYDSQPKLTSTQKDDGICVCYIDVGYSASPKLDTFCRIADLMSRAEVRSSNIFKIPLDASHQTFLRLLDTATEVTINFMCSGIYDVLPVFSQIADGRKLYDVRTTSETAVGHTMQFIGAVSYIIDWVHKYPNAGRVSVLATDWAARWLHSVWEVVLGGDYGVEQPGLLYDSLRASADVRFVGTEATRDTFKDKCPVATLRTAASMVADGKCIDARVKIMAATYAPILKPTQPAFGTDPVVWAVLHDAPSRPDDHAIAARQILEGDGARLVGAVTFELRPWWRRSPTAALPVTLVSVHLNELLEFKDADRSRVLDAVGRTQGAGARSRLQSVFSFGTPAQAENATQDAVRSTVMMSAPMSAPTALASKH